MKLCILLHFYQPYNQQDDILHRIVNESYLPITRGLLKSPKARLAVNISGCLTKLLATKGYNEVLDNLKELAKRGRIELTSSANYHAFLPLLPEGEIARQIELNDEFNRSVFGDLYEPQGFFPPELAVDSPLLSLLAAKKYKWVAAPQLSFPTGNPNLSTIYIHSGSGLSLMFRNRRVSSLVLSGICKTAKGLKTEITDIYSKSPGAYLFLAMDAETFGHHRIGHEQALIDMLGSDLFTPVTARQLLQDKDIVRKKTDIRAATWTNEEQDFWLDKEKTKLSDKKSFILWKDPANPIHALQWQLTALVINQVDSYPNKNSKVWITARNLLDIAISSDQYWWASAKPWWSLEMLEQGAYELKKVLVTLDPKAQGTIEGETLYRKILDVAFEWQRTGLIRKRHLENSGTYLRPSFSQRTPTDWYNLVVLEFEDAMTKAAERRNYEEAIKWRDAMLKLKLGTDIYDVLHVVDELWSARNLPTLKAFWEYEWEEFSQFAHEQFIEVHSKEDFERWKSSTDVQQKIKRSNEIKEKKAHLFD